MGCPIFSAGPEAYLAEVLLIHAYPSVLKFIRDVAAAENFRNPRYVVDETAPEPDDARYWKGLDDKLEHAADREDVAAEGETANVKGDGSAQATEAPQSPAADHAVLGRDAATASEKETEEEKKTQNHAINGVEEKPSLEQEQRLPTTCIDVLSTSDHDHAAESIAHPAARETAIDDLIGKMDKLSIEAAAEQTEDKKEKEQLEFMRGDVPHTVEQVENMTEEVLERGTSKVGDGTDDEKEGVEELDGVDE
jgi:hypothetical protein